MASQTNKKDLVMETGNRSRNEYFISNMSPLHPAQEKLIKLTQPVPLSIMLSATDSTTMLSNMLKFAGAKKCIDVGVYTGYSSLSWALSIPEGGKVVACDVSMEYANVGIPVWKEAGVDDKIDLRIAPAVETLQAMVDAGESESYDFMYIDADKQGYDDYYEFGLKLVRRQGIIAIDNAFWHGRVLDPQDKTERTEIIRNLNLKIKSDERVTASLIDIGDGIYLCLKK